MERCQVCAEEKPLCFHDEVERSVEVIRCGVCRDASRLPWDVLVGILLGCGMQMANQFSVAIHATCQFFSRTTQELWSEVDQIQTAYTEEQANGS